MRRLRARRARSQAAAIHLRLLAKSIVGHPLAPGIGPESNEEPWKGYRIMLRTKNFRPCLGSINATSYPGARAPGYYLSAPPGLCRAGGVSQQKISSRPAILLLSLFILLPPALAQDLQVTASVSTDTIGIQDQFQLTITVTGSDSGLAQTPRLPRFQGFRVVAGPSLSTQFQWINGRSTSSKSFIYILLPEKEGQFTIDPVEVPVGSRVYRTQSIAIRVTSASRAPSPPARTLPTDPFGEDLTGGSRRNLPAGDEVFVTAELDRTTAYPGQQVTLTYHLYTQVNVGGLQLQENPPLTGFWVENLDVESKPTGTRKIINGREYLDYVIKRQALFPNAPGTLRIPSSTFAVSVKTTGDFFGLFGQTETVYRKTKEVTLDVRPLPTLNRPEGFTNAVGSFTIAGELNKSSVATGDAVSLRMKLAGIGNLKGIADLPLPALPDLTIYPSKREDNVHAVAGNQIGGEKVWEYVVIPKVPGEHSIPPFSFSYFDPDLESFKTVATQPLPLKVVRGSDTESAIAGLSGINRQNLTRQGTDINFIKLSEGELAVRRRPLYHSPWFYLFATLPFLFNLGAFLVQRRRARQSGDAVLTRRRMARRLALDRLRRAEKAGRAEPRRFYDEAARALSGYLADRFNLPEIAVTADTLERTMAEHAIAAETVKGAVSALQECDFGRFVSASPAPERQTDLARRIRAIIETMERSER